MSIAKRTVKRDSAWGAVVTLVVLVGVVWPLTWPGDRDSFPLSNYPMFAGRRLTSACSLAEVYGSDEAGRREKLSPRAIGKPSLFGAALQLNRLSQLIESGRVQALATFCREIAAHVGRAADLAWVRRVEIVRNDYDSLVFHAGTKQPVNTMVYEGCAVQP